MWVSERVVLSFFDLGGRMGGLASKFWTEIDWLQNWKPMDLRNRSFETDISNSKLRGLYLNKKHSHNEDFRAECCSLPCTSRCKNHVFFQSSSQLWCKYRCTVQYAVGFSIGCSISGVGPEVEPVDFLGIVTYITSIARWHWQAANLRKEGFFWFSIRKSALPWYSHRNLTGKSIICKWLMLYPYLLLEKT